MSEFPKRFDHVRRSAMVGRLFAMCGVMVTLIIAGYLLFSPEAMTDIPHLLLGFGLAAAGLLVAAALIFLWGVVDLALKTEANTFRIYDVLRDVQASLAGNEEWLRGISENTQLSSTARAIIYRGKERTSLRLAINEEIIRGDWEAAYALVEQLEERHGYKNEAARLRAEVDRSRERDKADKDHEVVARVKAYLERQDWDRARREMDRLIADHPGNPEVRELPRLFVKYRDEHKRRLLKEWDQVVQRNEIDRGIAILKALDQYLTRTEAAALEESARGVFRAKLHNLGVQFSLAVTDQEWSLALEAGHQIMREFPNSQMAQEVRDRIHLLKKRAEEGEADTSPVE